MHPTDRSRFILLDTGSGGRVRRLARWRLRLFEFDFDGVQQTGVRHQSTDALFQLPTDRTGETPVDDDLSVMVISTINNKVNKDSSHMLEDVYSILLRLYFKPKVFEAPTFKNIVRASG